MEVHIAPDLLEELERSAANERLAAMSHIEEGFLQAERGELIDSDQARREIEEFKDNWRRQRQSTQ